MSTETPGSLESSVRDELAQQRTQLANERTLLAYVRTAIMLVVTGATLLKLYGDEILSLLSGWSIIAVGLSVALLGWSRFRRLAQSLN